MFVTSTGRDVVLKGEGTVREVVAGALLKIPANLLLINCIFSIFKKLRK
jgi:hypothetical protein